MSENWRCDNWPSDHLFGVIDYAQSQIEMWRNRQKIAMAELVLRGEIADMSFEVDDA